jgi:hypothetical protein
MLAIFRNLALVLAAAIGLSGCASKVAPEKLATIKTVTVVAATGNRFNWSTKPTVGFSQSRVIPLPEWDMDARITAIATSVLSPRYTIVAAEGIDIGFLTSVDHLHAIDYLQRHAGVRKAGADAVLLFREHWIEIKNPGEGPPRVQGIGIFRRNSLIGPVITAYAVLEGTLIDLRTSQTISYFRTRLPDDPWPHARFSHPLGPDNAAAWFDPFEVTPADKKEMIQRVVYDVLERSIPHTLRDRGLVD